MEPFRHRQTDQNGMKRIRPKEEFLQALRDSSCAVGAVAEWLRSKKYQVTLLPNEERDNYADRKNFVDNGDLLLGVPVEVKQDRKRCFTSLKDYPFSHVIVMSKHAWDAKRPKPIFVVRVDKDMKAALITHHRTEKQWIEAEITDGRDGQTQTVYKCPKELCEFIQFEDRK